MVPETAHAEALCFGNVDTHAGSELVGSDVIPDPFEGFEGGKEEEGVISELTDFMGDTVDGDPWVISVVSD